MDAVTFDTVTIRAGRAGSMAVSGTFAQRNPAAAAEWCTELNLGAGPNEVTAANGQKAYFRCSTCAHVWLSEIKSRHRVGCPACSVARRSDAVRRGKLREGHSLADVFPKIAAEWDPAENKLTPNDFASKSNLAAAWICATCGHAWRATIASRTQVGAGCPACGPARKVESLRDAVLASGRSPTLEEAARTDPSAKRLMEQWDAELNDLPPSRLTIGSRYRAAWICKQGHRWRAAIDGRFKRGDGCRECSKGRRVSRIELLAYAEARLLWPDAEHQGRVGGREVDVLVRSIGIAIEVDGYFHGLPDAPKRDRAKTKILTRHGIRVFRLRVRGSDYLSDGSIHVWGKTSRLVAQDVLTLFRVIAEVTKDASAVRHSERGELLAVAEAARLWRDVTAHGGPTRQAPELTRAAIDELKRSGLTQRAIAQKYGVSVMVVSVRARE